MREADRAGASRTLLHAVALAAVAGAGGLANACRGPGREAESGRAARAEAPFEAEATLVPAGAPGAPEAGGTPVASGKEGAGGAADGSAILEAWCASGGRAVRIGAGAQLRFRGAGDPAGRDRVDRVLWLRVACAGGAELAFGADDDALAALAALVVPATFHRERFEWLRAGPIVAAGGLRIAWRSGAEVTLDRWALLREGESPPPSWSGGIWRSRDGTIELRAAADARVADPEWVLLVAREQRDAVASRFDAAISSRERPLLLVALAASRWPRADAGAFQNGCAIFLRDDELHLPWRSYAHELAHLHEDARGRALPWFLSEGIACAIALEVEAQILGEAGPVAERNAALDRLLDEGDGWHRPGASAPNAAFLIDADPRDAAQLASAYDWSTALLRGAARAGGAGFWRRLDAAIALEPVLQAARPTAASAATPGTMAGASSLGPPGTARDAAARAQAIAAAGRALEAAAGRPLGDLLPRVGWPRTPGR